MTGSTISNTVTSTVTLGSALYPSPLTVTGSGDVAVTAFSAIGIFGPADSGTLINDGKVTGGAGGTRYSGAANGGTGVELLSGSTATNIGTITGGAAGYNEIGVGGRLGGIGGAGVSLDGGSLANSGLIAGGYALIGDGGYGAALGAGTLTNTGVIAGGNAETGNSSFDQQSGGAGVELAGSAVLVNNGTISGGFGNHGGVGIDMLTGASLSLSIRSGMMKPANLSKDRGERSQPPPPLPLKRSSYDPAQTLTSSGSLRTDPFWRAMVAQSCSKGCFGLHLFHGGALSKSAHAAAHGGEFPEPSVRQPPRPYPPKPHIFGRLLAANRDTGAVSNDQAKRVQ